MATARARRFVLACLVWVVLRATGAAAQEASPAPDPSVEAGVETDAASRYLFRGLVFSAGPVTQSKAWVSAGGLDLYAWTNMAWSTPPGARTLDEVDVGAAYTWSRGALAVTPALDVYRYRLSDDERASGIAAGTAEVSLAIAATGRGTTVSSKLVVDAGSYRGARVVQLGVAHGRRVARRTDLEAAVLVGWASAAFNRAYIGPDVAALGLVSIGLSMTHRVGRWIYLRPHVEVSMVPDRRLRDAVARPGNVVLGLAVGVAR